MACECGCDVDDHLHNLPNRPPSPNTFFENFWAPNFVELLVSRLRTVQDEFEPSKRVLWRGTYGGDAQDIAPSWHKWVNPLVFSDEVRGRGMPVVSRLPTPNFEEIIREERRQDLLYNSDNSTEAQKRPSPRNEEENPQNPLPPTKGAAHTPSVWSQEIITSTSFPDAFDPPVSNLSVKLATHTQPFQLDQGYSVSGTPRFCYEYDRDEKISAVKPSYFLRPASQATRESKRTKEEIRVPMKRKAESMEPADRLGEQVAYHQKYIPRGCPCGCGGKNLYCLRPNRPPSPNTFYENFWAPNFAYMLRTRLEEAARKLEPSKRIWWREEFGGCAPDREPLDSEIWAFEGDDRGNVLRTSPPPFSDDTFGSRSKNEDPVQPYRKRQRSTSPLNTPIRSPDEAYNTPLQDFTYGHCHTSKGIPLYNAGESPLKELAKYRNNPNSSRDSFTRTSTPPTKARSPKSPTNYIPNRFPPLNVPKLPRRRPPRANIGPLSEEEDELLRQKFEALTVQRNRLLGINVDRCKNVPGGSMTSAVDSVAVCEAGEKSTKRFANDWAHADDSSRSSFRAPTVRPEAKPPKSPTHYIPDRFSPRRSRTFLENVHTDSRERRPQQRRTQSFCNQADERLKPRGLNYNVASTAYILNEIKFYLLRVHPRLPRSIISRRCHQLPRPRSRIL